MNKMVSPLLSGLFSYLITIKAILMTLPAGLLPFGPLDLYYGVICYGIMLVSGKLQIY